MLIMSAPGLVPFSLLTFIFFVPFTSESYLSFCKAVVSLTSTAECKMDMSGNKLLKKICELN